MTVDGSAPNLFLGAYHFDGDPAELLPAYHRLLEMFPPDSLVLHLCVVRDGGLTVFDACPSREVHAEFVRSPGFTGAVESCGLPTPRIEGLGDVHVARVAEAVRG